MWANLDYWYPDLHIDLWIEICSLQKSLSPRRHVRENKTYRIIHLVCRLASIIFHSKSHLKCKFDWTLVAYIRRAAYVAWVEQLLYIGKLPNAYKSSKLSRCKTFSRSIFFVNKISVSELCFFCDAALVFSSYKIFR